MKKIVFALVLCMILTLFGCGQTVDVRKEAQEGEEKLTAVEECHLLVQLTVQHKLELYLDENGTVLKAAAGDEEGEGFLTGLELIGLSYEEAVSAILARAAEQGILAENADIAIDVLASADGSLTYEQIQQLEKAVSDYDALLVPFADQSVVVAEDCGAEKVVVDTLANGDLFYDYYVNDIAVRQVCYHTDGSYTEWIYDETGRNTLAVINVTADGRRTEERNTYENGVQTGWAHTIQEGEHTVYEEMRYENGQVVYSCMKDSEGTSSETSYFSDGTVEMTRESRPDGSVSEIHYYPNGKTKTSEEHCPNGESYVYRYAAYEEDGSSVREEKTPDGTTRYSEINSSGMEIYYRCTYANGDWEERSFYPSGSPKSEAGSVGGEEYSFRYDENGQIVEE